MKHPIILSIICTLFLSSCASKATHGSEEVGMLSIGDYTKESPFILGETTKKEIIEYFGPNYIVSTNNSGNELWTYKYIKGNLDKGSRTSKDLFILFDSNGYVIDHELQAYWVSGGSVSLLDKFSIPTYQTPKTDNGSAKN